MTSPADKPPGGPGEHPLPWRWETNGAGEESLVSSDGWLLITAHDGVSTDSPYVRAVTERAGALEKALAEVCGSLAAYLSEHDGDWKESGYEDAMALLAEIEAVKKGR